MKKILVFALSLVLVFGALTGCGQSANSSSANVDLQAFHASLFEKYPEYFTASVDATEYAEMFEAAYPGLSAIETKQLLVYQPMMSFVVCELALVEVANAADVQTVKDIFQKRIDDQVAGGAFYPESVAGWTNNAHVVSNGNYVMLIAWNASDGQYDENDNLITLGYDNEVVEMFNDLF